MRYDTMSEHNELNIDGELAPYPSGNDVYWEKWTDAYNNDGIEASKKLIEDIREDEYDLEDDDERLALDKDEDIPFFDTHIQTILTPFGVLPLTEDSFVSNHFKFWVGHANFKLWDAYYKVIGDILGVESVDILTPLRFRIAVGKMFKDEDVMSRVRSALLEVVNNESKE